MERSLNKRIYPIIAGAGAYIFFCLTLFAIGRKANDMPLFPHSRLIMAAAFLLCLAIYSVIMYLRRDDLYEQTLVVDLFISLILIPLLKLIPGYLDTHDYIYAIIIAGSAMLAICPVILDLLRRDSILRSAICRIEAKRNIWLLILAVILLALSYERVTYYMWDACLFFRQMDNTEPDWLLDLYHLSFWGHPAYSYTLLASAFKLIFGTAVAGQNFYGRLLLIIGAYGFWKLSHLFFDDAPEWLYFLLALSYSVSPFYLGMVTYSYNDSAMWYIFPLLLYVLYSRKWIWSFWLGSFFVFVKEPCVVVYSFLLLGIYIVESIRVRRLVHDVGRYLILLLPCFMFVASFLFMPRYTETSFILSGAYTVDKIKSFYLVNFNWLFAILGLIGILIMIRSGNYLEELEYIFPILVSGGAFIIVSILADTGVVHPRYVDSLIAQIYIIESFLIMSVIRDRRFKGLMIAAQGILLIISSFHTIDPVMKNYYPQLDVGRTQMTYLYEKVSDAWCYNRQYNNFGYVFDMALEDVVADPNCVIYTPSGPGNFDGRGTYPSFEDSSEAVLDLAWDPVRQTRMTDKDAQGVIPYQLHVILDEHEFDLNPRQQGCYIYADYCGSEIADRIRGTMNVIDESSYEKSGWIMHRITFDGDL